MGPIAFQLTDKLSPRLLAYREGLRKEKSAETGTL